MAVQFTDFDFCSETGIIYCHPAERDVLPQDRRARAARDNTHLTAAHMNTIAVGRRLVAFQFETHESSLRMVSAAKKSILPDEVVFLALNGYGEADAGLERVNLVVEFVTGKDQPRFNA